MSEREAPESTPGHTHGHAHAGVDWADRGEDLVLEAEVFAPAVDSAIGWLGARVPAATTVLDLGSGPGVAACSFAEEFPDAQIVAVDGSEPLLALTRERAARLGMSARVTTRAGQLPDDLSGLPEADLVWVSGVAHHLADPVEALRLMGSLVRPGGLLVLREGGLPMRFLPDGAAPGLHGRLDAAIEDLSAAGEHPFGVVDPTAAWPALLAKAGLEPAGTRSFLLDLPAPLDARTRRWLHRWLTKSLESLRDHLGEADVDLLEKLVDEESEQSVLRQPDVFVLRATTVHTARPSS